MNEFMKDFKVRFAMYGVDGIRYSTGWVKSYDEIQDACLRLLDQVPTDTKVVVVCKSKGRVTRLEVSRDNA